MCSYVDVWRQKNIGLNHAHYYREFFTLKEIIINEVKFIYFLMCSMRMRE